ncbi:plancitoxin-1-like isoform X2 [Ostrea edulis]|uniref:plancitoxin-1-like isoform X2 n=1 Tax=Ostrea edulis TaxID=37623 RepID=UPI0024AFCAAE|nr:plancitoxin-1-like isoform X2 [Ostrea edulis]
MGATVIPFTVILLNMGVYYCFCLSCMTPSGRPVDWFMMYKVPRSTHSMPIKTTGEEFYYLDSDRPVFSFNNVSIQKEHGNPLFKTLQQIYGGKSRQYAMYNDERPPSTGCTIKQLANRTCQGTLGAHMKGAYAFDDKSGFWLILSVPKFPAPKKHGYSYGKEQISKGQTVLCVTLHSEDLQKMERVFNLTKPMFYDGNGPTMKTSDLHNTTSSIDIPFISKGGQKFRSFAKSAYFGKDLYDSLVAVNLRDDLFVETWYPNLPSNCSTTYKVQNVKTVGFDNGYSFPATIDHAKWAVTKGSPWICIGDINRNKSQFKRGGGTMCLSHEGVSNQFRKLVKDYQNCSRARDGD